MMNEVVDFSSFAFINKGQRRKEMVIRRKEVVIRQKEIATRRKEIAIRRKDVAIKPRKMIKVIYDIDRSIIT